MGHVRSRAAGDAGLDSVRVLTAAVRRLSRGVRPGLAAAARGVAVAAAIATASHAQPVLDRLQTRQFDEAERAFSERRYADAAEGYSALASQVPQAAELHAKLGLSHFFGRRCDLSAPAFERAVALRPDLRAGHVLLAICLSELGRYAEALPDLERGYEDPPEHPGVQRLAGLELVRSYLGLGQHARAAKLAAELQIAHPDDPEVLFHANRTYREVATQAAFAIARVAPESVWSHQAMGETYESSQYYELAIMEYRKALEKEPGRPGLRYRLGEALLAKAGQPDQAGEALGQFEREFSANPSHALAALRAGEIHHAMADHGKALEFLQRAVALRPALAEARIALGKLLLELERAGEAVSHLEQAVQASPSDPGVRYQLARAYRSAGNVAAHKQQLDRYRQLQADRRDRDQQILLGSPEGSADGPAHPDTPQ